VKFCTNQRVRVSDKEKLLLLRTELGTNLEPQSGLAAQIRTSEKLLLDFGSLRVSLDQRQSRSSEPTIGYKPKTTEAQ
jgi:hypothetical protein